MPRRAITLQETRIGLFGKLPARGDFVRQELPRDFTDPWDAWWQRGLADTQCLAGDDWPAAWMEAPVWRFALAPRVCGRRGVVGLWLPSVDKVGRFFPLTIAATASGGWVPLDAWVTFLDAAEAAGRAALNQGLAPAALLDRVQTEFLSAGEPGAAPGSEVLPQDFAPGLAAWWTGGGRRVAPRSETGPGLPEGRRFAALIDDGWEAM